jgi:exosortase
VSRDLRVDRGAWSRGEAVGAALLVALGVAATWDAWRDILHVGLRDAEQNHVFLAPVIAAWLAWVRRERLRRCPRDARWVGPVLVAAGWALYSGGDRAGYEALFHLGAIVVGVGCFHAFAGGRYLRRLLPALVALAFLVPVPGFVRMEVALPLQTATADATQRALDLLGVPVVRAGNALRINGVDIAIAEACNGLRMVFALTLVSYAFAYSMPIRHPVRLLIVAASPATALFCNVVRLVPTAWVYGYVSADAGAWLHDVGVWVMLPLAFLLLLGVFRTLRWALVPVYRYTLAYGR